MRAYAASKLCNLLTAQSLAALEEVEARQITVIAFSPGLTGGTSLGRNSSRARRTFVMLLMRTVFRLVGLFRPEYVMGPPERAGAALADVALGLSPHRPAGSISPWSRVNRRSPTPRNWREAERLRISCGAKAQPWSASGKTRSRGRLSRRSVVAASAGHERQADEASATAAVAVRWSISAGSRLGAWAARSSGRRGLGTAGALPLEYRVRPLPPPGPLTFVGEWPGRGIPGSRVEVDGAAIRQAADAAVTLWLDDPYCSHD
jgi:hypothetical protein